MLESVKEFDKFLVARTEGEKDGSKAPPGSPTITGSTTMFAAGERESVFVAPLTLADAVAVDIQHTQNPEMPKTSAETFERRAGILFDLVAAKLERPLRAAPNPRGLC
jgi:hypothetical protein